MEPKKEAAFNAPPIVIWTIAALILAHVARLFLTDDQDIAVLLRFAFIPGRYDPNFAYAGELLGGEGAKVWTFLSYAFLHGSFTHLAVNAISLLAFGSALAWRFGAWRFALFSALTAAAGAATHLAIHWGAEMPVIGASAAISGHMAGAMRFVFETGGPLGVFRARGREAFLSPAEPLMTTLRRPQALAFLVIMLALNALVGVGQMAIGTDEAPVAWEAHIGGFIAGLALFALLDPVKRRVLPSSQETLEALPPDGERPHDGETGAAGRP